MIFFYLDCMSEVLLDSRERKSMTLFYIEKNSYISHGNCPLNFLNTSMLGHSE